MEMTFARGRPRWAMPSPRPPAGAMQPGEWFQAFPSQALKWNHAAWGDLSQLL